MSEEKDVEKKINLEGFAASVELPEGHQIVLGELPPGTVVEVATWQGTGRPDDTTRRFYMSASGGGLQRRERGNQNNNEDIVAAIQREIPAPEESTEPEITPQPELTPEPEITPVQEVTSDSVAEPVSDSVQVQEDISVFETTSTKSLGSVGAGSTYLGMRTFGVDTPPAPIKKSRSGLKKFAKGTVTVLSIVAITSLILSLAGISAIVPSRGADTVFGPSTNTLVIFKKSPSVTIGSPTVALIQVGDKEGYVFGPSNSFDEDTFQIETTAGQELVERKNVVGRAFLAIPLLGIIAKPLMG
jgi:hypothetical protein